MNDRYELLRPLGQGGMAKVYLAHDGLLGRDVAFKVLREHYAEDGGFVERFEREAKAAASLSHPNVVQIHDRGCSEDGRYYIVMEYVAGGTLKERVKAEGPLGHAEAAGLAAEIAGALGAAHAGGVVHRDVKPQNVLLAGGGAAKVADFGIAKAASAASISRTDLIVGTPNYMSPEQATGGSVGPRSDLYSLGVVLYEMLTGRVPFEAETPLAVCTMHVDEPAPSPHEANPEVPEALDAITLRLLSKDPDDRHASAEELIEDLRRAADGAAGIARGGEPTLPLPARAARGRRRRKAPLALASLTVLGGLLGGGYLWQGSEGPGIAGFLRGVPEEARRALGDAGRAVGSLGGVAQAAEVPRVVGLSAEEAEERLAEAGFESERRPRESSEEDLDEVLEQSVRWGEEAEEGSIILLAIGAGPQDEEGAGPAPSYDEEQYQGEAPSYDEEQPAPVAQERAQYEEPVAPAPEPAPAEDPAPVSAPVPVAQQPTPAPAPEPEQPAPAPEEPAQYEEPAAPTPDLAPVAAEEPAFAPEQQYRAEPATPAPEPERPAPAPEERAQYEEPAAPEPEPAPAEQRYYEEPAYDEEPAASAPEPEPAPVEQPSQEDPPREDSGDESGDGGGDQHGRDQYEGGSD